MANGKRPSDGRNVKMGANLQQGDNDAEADEAPPTKRSRVSRACDQCRAGREKCDGAQPECMTCSSQNRQCSYNEQTKKRGIRSNFIRTLELTLAWLLQTFPETESLLSTSLPNDSDSVHRLISGKDNASEALYTAWRSCLINKQLDQLLSGVSIERHGQLLTNDYRSSQPNHQPHHSPPLSAPSKYSDTGHELICTSSGPETSHAAGWGQRSEQNLSGRSADVSQTIKLPKNALALLEFYFAFTHSWLPMCEKHTLLKLLYTYPAGGLSLQDLTVAEHAELWSMMALSAMQLAEEADQSESLRIRQVAESLLPPTSNPSFEVPHLKAMLHLTLIDVLKERMLAAWLSVSTVVSLLLLFRLLENLGSTEKWCRHIHLVAFVLESAIASHLDVPPHFRGDYIQTVGFVEEDGLDEWAPWSDPLDPPYNGGSLKAPARSFSTLNELVRICMRSPHGDFNTNDAFIVNSATDSSIVFALLRNATLKQDRLQPSSLLVDYRKSTSDSPSTVQVPTNTDQSIARDYTSSPIMTTTDRTGPPQPGIGDVLDHRFVSIPSDMDALSTLQLEGAQNSTDAIARIQMNAPDSSISQAAESGTMIHDGLTADADIFEEFNAILERHDSSSNHNPQFLQNLGFAPDIDLAEFFGADYQPSDPFLAYIHPTTFGTNQGNMSQTG